MAFGPASAAASTDDLDSLMSRLQSDSQFSAVIRAPLQRRKSGRILELKARITALSLFQDLVERGIDPARIGIEDIGSSGRVTLDLVSGVPPQKRAQPIPNPLNRRGDGESFLFPADETELPEVEAERARSLAQQLAGKAVSVTIIGHGDVRGDHAYNVLVGEARALAVYECLVRAGMRADRVVIESRGRSEPRFRAEAEKARWYLDRRVVVIVQVDEATAAAPEAPLAPETASIPVEDAPPALAATSVRTAESSQEWHVWLGAGVKRPVDALAADLDAAPNFALGVELPGIISGSGAILGLGASYAKFATERSGQTNRLTTANLLVLGGWEMALAQDWSGIAFGEVGINSWRAESARDARNQQSSGVDREFVAGIGVAFAFAPDYAILGRLAGHGVSGGFAAFYASGILGIRARH